MRPSILPFHSASNPWSTLSLAQTLPSLLTQIVLFYPLRLFGPHLALTVAPKEEPAGIPSPMTIRTYFKILATKTMKTLSGMVDPSRMRLWRHDALMQPAPLRHRHVLGRQGSLLDQLRASFLVSGFLPSNGSERRFLARSVLLYDPSLLPRGAPSHPRLLSSHSTSRVRLVSLTCPLDCRPYCHDRRRK